MIALVAHPHPSAEPARRPVYHPVRAGDTEPCPPSAARDRAVDVRVVPLPPLPRFDEGAPASSPAAALHALAARARSLHQAGMPCLLSADYLDRCAVTVGLPCRRTAFELARRAEAMTDPRFEALRGIYREAARAVGALQGDTQ